MSVTGSVQRGKYIYSYTTTNINFEESIRAINENFCCEVDAVVIDSTRRDRKTAKIPGRYGGDTIQRQHTNFTFHYRCTVETSYFGMTINHPDN